MPIEDITVGIASVARRGSDFDLEGRRYLSVVDERAGEGAD